VLVLGVVGVVFVVGVPGHRRAHRLFGADAALRVIGVETTPASLAMNH
jgi:hypothetical protein